jgi:hypothetical protein
MFIGKGFVAGGYGARGERHAVSAVRLRLGELASGKECSHEIGRVSAKQEAGVETAPKGLNGKHIPLRI